MSSCSIHEDSIQATLGAGVWSNQAYDWLIATWIHEDCAQKRLELLQAGYPGSPADLIILDSRTLFVYETNMLKRGFNLYLVHRTRLALIEKVIAQQNLEQALKAAILVTDCFGTHTTRRSMRLIGIAKTQYEQKERIYTQHLDKLHHEKTQLNPRPKRTLLSFSSRIWKCLTRLRISSAPCLRSRQSNQRPPAAE
jgi:hypothetical protein